MGEKRETKMKYHLKLFLSAGILAASMGIQTVQAAKTSITIALQLEPPHLDPTSAAAGAIDSVRYSNVFEGLTRFASDGAVIPGLAKSWEISLSLIHI